MAEPQFAMDNQTPDIDLAGDVADSHAVFDAGVIKVAPLTEGYLRKGGINPVETLNFERPAAPAPFRPASVRATRFYAPGAFSMKIKSFDF